MLDAYVALRDTMTDEEISDASGVSVAAVTAWRASLTAPAPEAEPSTADKPKRAKKAAADVSAPPVTPADPEADSAPATVRVTVARVSGVRFPGKQFDANVTYKGIFSGAEAAYLWANHRASVEPYPKA